MSSLTYRLASLGFVTLLAGCSSSFTLMPPPAYIDTEGYNEVAESYYERINATPELTVFYATDRKPAEQADPKNPCYYQPGRGDVLRLGTADIVFGDRNWTIGELFNKSKADEKIEVSCAAINEFGTLYTTLPPTSEIGVQAFFSESPDDLVRSPSYAFAEAINEQLANNDALDDDEIHIFVSGLNTTFENSVRHAASLHHYMARGGVMIAYPWPTRSNPWSISKDRLNGRVSARALRNLIIFLAEETDASHINVIGYSGGSDVLAQALYQIRLTYPDEDSREIIRQDLRLGEVILTSPDIDYMEFRNMLMDRLTDVANNFTIYVNANDKVISFSEKFSTGAPRLGNPGAAISKKEHELYLQSTRIDFVSPENGEKTLGVSDSMGHSYWYKNPWVSADVLIALTTPFHPNERGLVRHEGNIAWDFPDDYQERVEELFRSLSLQGKLDRPLKPKP